MQRNISFQSLFLKNSDWIFFFACESNRIKRFLSETLKSKKCCCNPDRQVAIKSTFHPERFHEFKSNYLQPVSPDTELLWSVVPEVFFSEFSFNYILNLPVFFLRKLSFKIWKRWIFVSEPENCDKTFSSFCFDEINFWFQESSSVVFCSLCLGFKLQLQIDFTATSLGFRKTLLLLQGSVKILVWPREGHVLLWCDEE